MHASTEQLLALRDREPTLGEIGTHVDECGECQRELATLRATREALRTIGTLDPPDLWPQIAPRLAPKTRRPAAAGRWAALAAGAALVALALSWLSLTETNNEPVIAGVPATHSGATDRDRIAARIDELVAQSAQLERQLKALKARSPAVMRLGHEAGTARLRAGLMALDAGRARIPEVAGGDALRQTYWNERVRLLDSMVDIERAEMIQRGTASYRVVPARL